MKLSAYYMKTLIVSSMLAAIFSGIGCATMGFVYGMRMHNIRNGSIDTTKCNQYTVLDATHVVTACGDTIQYHWKANVKPYGKK